FIGAPLNGAIDVGGRFTSTTGDEARYERYRDLRNGANVNVLFNKETSDWTFDAKGTNIGYRDQRYVANFNSRRVTFSVLFDQTPLNYSNETRTPFTCTAGDCSLDAGLRAQVQAKTPPTIVGVPQTVANLVTGSIYNSIARQFDLRSRRDTFAANARFSATDNLDFVFDYSTYKRSGNMPYGASFAFNVATELPIVIDNRETDVGIAVEWASHQGMFRAGYQRSKFDQAIPSFTFANPQFATDFCKTGIAGQAPGACYDPNGYVNGNGPAFGRTALPPSNSVDTFNWLGMVKLPGHTTANASFIMGANRQDAALIPWTTNTSIANAATYAAFPNLAALPRPTADMNVNYSTGTMNVSSRPSKYVTIAARYRFNSRSDFTREFDAVEYVRFDTVPEEGGGETEAINNTRNTFDVNITLTPIPFGAIRAGYGIDKLEHSARSSEGWKDHTARVSFDTVGNQFITLRALYEHTKRDSIGLDLEDITGAGGQQALRFYLEAARTRDRGTFIVELTPLSMVGVNFSLSTGKDDYQGADASQQFGLLNNKNTAYAVGVNVVPNEMVNFGADYGRETYNALLQSRTANPFSGVPGVYESWTDPKRNWNLTNDEKVNNVSVYLNLVKALPKSDIRFGYDYSDSDQAFIHGGPRIAALLAPSAPWSELGIGVAALDDEADRWAALSAPLPPLQVDRAAGGDYHVWPAAAPAAWLALSRSRFGLLS
ncbi:MAG TPA: MtrB/PioB family outer membrane beta-barrel protein, partial [Usitatibacter sp.]|nr:MtrB/PioB family outer membrane beta-barrel protein [Usitatibacter sp.]